MTPFLILLSEGSLFLYFTFPGKTLHSGPSLIVVHLVRLISPIVRKSQGKKYWSYIYKTDQRIYGK